MSAWGVVQAAGVSGVKQWGSQALWELRFPSSELPALQKYLVDFNLIS